MTSVTPALGCGWRVPANGPASIRILSPLSFECYKVQIVDASSNAMSMRINEYLERGVLAARGKSLPRRVTSIEA